MKGGDTAMEGQSDRDDASPDAPPAPSSAAVSPAPPSAAAPPEPVEIVPVARPTPRASLADRHVGMRIRERRVLLGLSQQQLAVMIGVTYQQAHKYERGLNRISAGRLYDIASVLNVPISWFFEGIPEGGVTAELSPRQRMCLELARNFSMIDNQKHQEALSQMARALAQAVTAGTA